MVIWERGDRSTARGGGGSLGGREPPVGGLLSAVHVPRFELPVVVDCCPVGSHGANSTKGKRTGVLGASTGA